MHSDKRKVARGEWASDSGRTVGTASPTHAPIDVPGNRMARTRMRHDLFVLCVCSFNLLGTGNDRSGMP